MNENPTKNIIRRKAVLLNKVPKGVWFLFIVWPFASFIYALRRYKAPWTSKIFLGFAAFFGFTFVRYGDADRVANMLKNMRGIGIIDVFADYFATESGKLDIVYTIITYVVSIFTDDYRFLFAILAFIFTFFITKSLIFLIQHSFGRIGWLDGLMLIAFAFTVQVWYLGGRWNLAALVFSYGLLMYFYTNNRKFLFLSFFSVLIHWTFFIVIPIVLLYFFAKNKTLVYFVFFLISFFFSAISTPIAQNAFEEYAPEAILESRKSYFNEEVIESTKTHNELANWYVTGHRIAINIYILVAASFLFLHKQTIIRRSRPLFNLFNFSLLFLGIANSFSSIQNMERFFTVGHWLFLAFFFLYLHEVRGRFHPLIKTFGIIVLAIYIIVRIRIAIDFISVWTVFGNPLFVYFVDNETPIIDVIKWILPI